MSQCDIGADRVGVTSRPNMITAQRHRDGELRQQVGGLRPTPRTGRAVDRPRNGRPAGGLVDERPGRGGEHPRQHTRSGTPRPGGGPTARRRATARRAPGPGRPEPGRRWNHAAPSPTVHRSPSTSCSPRVTAPAALPALGRDGHPSAPDADAPPPSSHRAPAAAARPARAPTGNADRGHAAPSTSRRPQRGQHPGCYRNR